MQNLFEDFVVLKMLSAEPAQSSSNTLNDHRTTQNGAGMSLEHERRIVNCLAFLFAITDNPLKVGALCLERDEQRHACTIRVAMNTGVSEEFMTGFRSLARALEDACNTAVDTSGARPLLEVATRVDRNRILSRLRSAHARKSRKTGAGLILRLKSMMTALDELGQCHAPTPLMRSITAKLLDDFLALEAMPGSSIVSGEADHVLLSILYRLDDLPIADDLQSLLKNVPVDKFQGPDSFILTLAKLRNYHASCQYLYIAARKFDVFHHVSVETVDVNLLMPIQARSRKASMLGVLTRLQLSWNQNTSRRFGVNLETASTQFRNELSSLKPKVHAEIQLIYHYETHPQLMLPNVICSSKSACFLCDAFVKAHGTFFVSRSHGVLYPQWTLPALQLSGLPQERRQALESVVRSFTQRIETRIRELWVRSRATRVHPSESVASLALWTPAISVVGLTTCDTKLTLHGSSVGAEDTRAVKMSQTDASNIDMESMAATAYPRGSLQSDTSGATQNLTRGSAAKNADLDDNDNVECVPDTSSLVSSGHDGHFDAISISRCTATRVRTSHDLTCKLDTETAANIRDHGSRTRVTHTGCETSANVSHPVCVMCKIDFHDEKIHFEVEIPKSATLSVKLREQPEHTQYNTIVDVTTLPPGGEIVVDAYDEPDGGKSIVLADRNKMKMTRKLWWKVSL